MGDSNHNHGGVSPLLVGILGVGSGAILVAFIHCMYVSCRSSSPTPTPQPTRPPNMYRRPRIRVERESNASLSFPSSASASSSSGNLSNLMTVHKFTKDFKEGTCAICLGEFEENDEVRIMPECAHVFHVACIDMWLFSHGNCPLCRANATPRTQDILLSILTSHPVA